MSIGAGLEAAAWLWVVLI